MTTETTSITDDEAGAAVCCCLMEQRQPEHHDRMLRLEDDPDVLAELLDVALCWFECMMHRDHISPEDWIEFAAIHEWRNRKWVYETMLLLSRSVWRDSCDRQRAIHSAFVRE